MHLFTIGHSNHRIEDFINLLHHHHVRTVVDVRTTPYSRLLPQFAQPALRESLRRAGIEYQYLGSLLGGRPQQDDLYDARGYALYDEFAKTDFFQEGIKQLLQILRTGEHVAIMCSEEDPNHCHRRLLITRYLLAHYQIDAIHIRKDGATQRESYLQSMEPLSLFEDEPDLSPVLRSSRPVPRQHKKLSHDT